MMDEQFINKIKGVKIDWDKEALWEELEPQLPRPKRRLPWRSILVCAVLFVMLYCGRENIATLYPSQETLLSSNEDVNNPTNITTPVEQQHTQVLANHEKTLPKSKTQLDSTAANRHNSDQDEKQKTTTLVYSEEGSPSTSVLRKKDSKALHLAVKAVENSLNTHQDSDSNNAADLNITEATLGSSPSSSLNKNSLEDIASGNKETPPLETQNSEDQSININTILARQEQRQVSYETDVLPTLVSKVVFSSTDKKLNLSSEITPVQYRLRQRKTSLYVDLSAGIGTLSRSAEVTTIDPVEEAALLDNKSFERTQFNTLTDLGIGYQMKTGLFLQSGLNYSEKHEQLNWQEIISIDTTKFFNERAYFSLDEFGDTTFYSGRSERIETTNQELKHWNKLKSYELPLAIGYVKRYNKLSFRASIGLVLNLSRQFEGRVIDATNNVVTDPDISLVTNLGYTAALGMAYQLLGEHQVFVNASYRQSPKFNVLSVEQSYQSLNIQLGVRAFLKR